MSRRATERWVVGCFLVATAATVGFVAAFVLQADTQVLGTFLGVACAAVALGLFLWAGLMPGRTFVESREPLAPPAHVEEEVLDAVGRGGSGYPRLLRRTFVLSLLGLGAAAVVPLRSLLPDDQRPPYQALTRTLWKDGGRRLMTYTGDLIRVDDLTVGSTLTAFPEGHPDADDATVILIRLDPQQLGRRTTSTRGDVSGVVAFSKLCTHVGCPVGLYEQSAHQLFCPCHQSVFDVLNRCMPVAGPAARPLPQLPIATDDDGYLIATGDFDGRVGATYWWHV